MHKETGELVVARNIWLEEDIGFSDINPAGYSFQIAYSIKNYAFENKYGVIMILPPKIQEHFEDLGEL